MPFAYSIADGLIAGICTYMVLNTVVLLVKIISGGRIVPPNYEERDGWTWRIPGGFLPPWMNRLAHGKKDFWREDNPPHNTNNETVVSDTAAPKENGSDHGGSEGGKVAETTLPREKET